MNLIHDLRNHYLRLRENEIKKEFPNYKDPQEEYSNNYFKNSLKEKEFKEPRDALLFKNKISRHANKKNQNNIKKDNLQDLENEYLDFNNIWDNVISDQNKKETFLWGKMNNDEKIEKLNEFVNEFNNISETNKEKLKNNLKNKIDNNFFKKNSFICWNKYQNKIFKIKNLVILDNDFYWE